MLCVSLPDRGVVPSDSPRLHTTRERQWKGSGGGALSHQNKSTRVFLSGDPKPMSC